MEYGIALRGKHYDRGLERNDVIELFDMLNNTEAFPIELEAKREDSVAMGFITPEVAEWFDYDYETSGLHDFVAEILDNIEKESDTCSYVFNGINIWLSR